jgi:hypothetical protein
MDTTVPAAVPVISDSDRLHELYRKGVREDYAARLPCWLQPAITRFTGKALASEVDVPAASPTLELVRDLGILTTSTALNVMAYQSLDWAVVPVCTGLMLVQVGRLRKLQVAHGHEAAHGDFFPPETRERLGRWSSPLNEFVLGLATTIPVVQNGRAYRKEHGGHHRFKVFTTDSDGDARFMLQLGFRPGMSVRALWCQLGRVLISGRDFHGPFALARLHSNLIDASGWRLAAGWAWISLLVGSAAVLPLGAWLLAVLLPLGPLYHVAAILQFCCEHAWLKSTGSVEDRKEYASRCWARFPGAPLPPRGLKGVRKLGAWARWVLRMAFIEVPVRVAVLPNVLQAHDLHHLAAWCGERLSDWVNTIYHRQRII